MTRWNDETFTLLNEKAKGILKSDKKKYTHHIVSANFGTDRADEIYKSSKCKENTSRAIITNKDINDILISQNEYVKLHGFVLLEDILKELKQINKYRQLNGLNYNTISPGCIKFIKSVLQNIPETKEILKQIRTSLYYFRKSYYR